jgi:hypothetical protein
MLVIVEILLYDSENDCLVTLVRNFFATSLWLVWFLVVSISRPGHGATEHNASWFKLECACETTSRFTWNWEQYYNQSSPGAVVLTTSIIVIPSLNHLVERKFGIGMHSKCREGIWRRCCRLSSRKDNRCFVPEVCSLILVSSWEWFKCPQSQVSSAPPGIHSHSHREAWTFVQS